MLTDDQIAEGWLPCDGRCWPDTLSLGCMVEVRYRNGHKQVAKARDLNALDFCHGESCLSPKADIIASRDVPHD